MAHKLDLEDVFRVYMTSSWDLLREVYILKLVILEMICLRVCVTHEIDSQSIWLTSQWDISWEVNISKLMILEMILVSVCTVHKIDLEDVFRVYVNSRWDI